MESFPAQSPEFSSDDDDDDSSESPAAQKEERGNAAKAEDKHAAKEEKAEPVKEDVPEPAAEDVKVPLESLAEDELRFVAQQYIDGRAESLNSELAAAPENSPDEAALLANAAMLEAIEAKLSQGETLGEQTVEEAVAETAQELEIEIPVTEEPVRANDAEAAIPPDTTEEQEPPEPAVSSAVPASPTPASGSHQVTPPNPNNPVTPVPPPPSPVSVTPHGPGGGNNLPPVAPARGYGNVPPFIPNYNTQVSPNVSTANPANAPENVIVKHNAAAPYLLLGYLIGRRRGRIKSEKKLLPVQKKLEKEVSDLHKSIAEGEEKIRKLARDKAEAVPGAAAKMAERLEERTKTKAEHEEKKELGRPEKEPAIKAETIGMLAVTKEKSADKADVVPIAEKQPKVPEPLKAPERPKDPGEMSVAELLVIAAHIPAEHGSVKKLYEKNILTERGLREIAQAYLRGERYEVIINKNRTGPEAISETNQESRSGAGTLEPGNQPKSFYGNTGRSEPSRPVGSRRSSSAPGSEHTHQPGSEQLTKSPRHAATSAIVTASVLAAIVLILFLLRR